MKTPISNNKPTTGSYKKISGLDGKMQYNGKISIVNDKLSGTPIKGITKHGLNQAITRGFKPNSIIDIVKKGTPLEAIGRYGPQTRFSLGGNTVIINSGGEVISVYSSASGSANGVGKGFFIPFK